jgi:hypothetical protein
MVLRSYEFFESQGDWSKYVTVRDAVSGSLETFLGTINSFNDLPLTVGEAINLWSLTTEPVAGDTCFVEVDGNHEDKPSQYVIESLSNIDLGPDATINWKYQFSVPIPTGDFQLKSNLVTNFSTDVDNTHYPSSLATNDLVDSAIDLIDNLTSELSILSSIPNIIKVVYDEDINVNIITVTLDMPMPNTHKLVVSSLKTGTSQVFTSSYSGNVYTLTFSDPVIVPFLVAVEKI